MKKRQWDYVYCIFKTKDYTYERAFKLREHDSLFNEIEQVITQDEGKFEPYKIISASIMQIGR